MIQQLRLVPTLLAGCVGLPIAAAQDWPHWRGPRFDGSTDAKGLPADFDQQANVRWTVDLPGPAACTPIVVGDHVFLSSVDTERERLVAMCIRRADGEVLWTKDADSGYKAGGVGTRVARGRRTTYASPSPTTDGERVVFFFGNGDLVAYDFDGEELWRRNVQQDYGDFAFNWTFSASPTLWNGKLFLPVLQRDVPIQRRGGGFGRGGRGRGGRRGGGEGERRRGGPPEGGAPPRGRDRQDPPADAAPARQIDSFLLAMDPATGKTVYKHVRPAPARMESLEAYTTVIPFVGDRATEELLVVGGDVITAHDPATGAERWRWGTWNDGHRRRDWRLVPSAVVGGGVALVCAPKRAPVYAVELGGEGELDDAAIRWQSEGRPNPVSSDVPTPAFYGAHFYVLSDVQSALSKVHPKDGEVVWSVALPNDYLWRASPTAADGKIWCINHNGEVVVVDAESGAIVHRVHMGEEDDDHVRASIVAAHGHLFIRTNSTLFCIGE